mgnify:CR=1 FL=1
MAPRVELSTATEPRTGPLPVVVRLSLAELTVLSDRLGGVELPFDLPGADAGRDSSDQGDRLEERLSGGAPSAGQRARHRLAAALAGARERPQEVGLRLSELGLVDDGGAPVHDVVAAFGVLAGPEALLVLDLAVTRNAGEDRLRSWFAVVGSQVVQLSTASGLTFELAWYDVAHLPGALARAATVEDDSAGPSGPASPLALPFELFSDGTEAVRRGREDLLAELVRIAPTVTYLAGEEVPADEVAPLVTSLEQASCGRLRVLVSAAQPDAVRRTAGVVSWLRVGDGWRSLTPVTHDGVPVVEIAVVAARDLARAVSPVLAEVLR